MRGTPAIIIVVMLLASAPLAATRALPAAPALPAPYPVDMTDAALLRLLAKDVYPTLPTPPAIDASPPATALVLKLGARTGAILTPEDVAMFADLDPRVDAPLRVMLATLDVAWAMRDAAFAGLTPDEQTELFTLTAAGDLSSPRALQLVSATDQTMLIAAAILLSDTIESIVVPALQDAAQNGAWPAAAVADPVGIVRLGGTGNDVETLNRVLQIDPRGNDLYRNNAGGTNTNDVLANPVALRYQVAVSLDFDGDDHYNKTAGAEAQGGAFGGIGMLYDLAGDDVYFCFMICQGAGARGAGYLRDYSGNDEYYGAQRKNGYGDGGTVGIHRDDGGADLYLCSAGTCAGLAGAYPSTGLLWDRMGVDTYDAKSDVLSIGHGDDGGRGWLVDEGASKDTYSTLVRHAHHGCNDCTWSAGVGRDPLRGHVGGRGNDNAGGLSFLMAQQGTGIV